MLEEREFDLKELLDSVGIVVDKQARERGITIITDGYPVEHRCLLGSPLHLRRLLMNIISNAVKYNRVGGEIRLGAAKSRVRIRRLHRLNSPVRIPVSA